MILVTGATGCLGANLVRALLTAGLPVAALRLADDPGEALTDVADQIEWRIGDLLNAPSLASAMRGVTHVYHAAGLALPYESDRLRMMEVNVNGTDNLLAAALCADVQRVVYVSSIAAVGYPDGIADETMTYNGALIPFSYMHSKYAAEAVARNYVGRGLDVVMVCPAAVIAPYCDREHGWGRVFLDVFEGKMPFLPPGGIAILSRADLVHGLQAAMAHGRSGERYILASANISYQTLLETMARTIGVGAPRLKIPRWLLRAGAFVLSFLAPLIEKLVARPRLSASVLDLMWRQKHYSIGKAERELKFVNGQTLDETVLETWTWLRANHTAGRNGNAA